MDVAECMEAYQQGQKLRKAKIKVELLRNVGCLLIGQKNENLFPNMRVRHGVHIRSDKFYETSSITGCCC